MASTRDVIRAARQAVMQLALRQGINLDVERRRPDVSARTLTFAAHRLINDATPRVDTDALVEDTPPAGTFDGVNTTFTLSAAVLGQNVSVVYTVQSTGVQTVLTRSTANPPPADSFYFDGKIDPTKIVVGTAPAAADGLAAIFKAVR